MCFWGHAYTSWYMDPKRFSSCSKRFFFGGAFGVKIPGMIHTAHSNRHLFTAEALLPETSHRPTLELSYNPKPPGPKSYTEHAQNVHQAAMHCSFIATKLPNLPTVSILVPSFASPILCSGSERNYHGGINIGKPYVLPQKTSLLIGPHRL